MRVKLYRTVALVGGVLLLSLGLAWWWTPGRIGLERLRTVHLPGRAFGVALSSNIGKFVILNRNHAWVCDSATGTPIESLNNPSGHSLGRIAMSRSADKIAVASGNGTLNVFKLTDGSPLWSKQVTRLQFSDVRFFPSGARMAISDGIWHEPEDNGGAIRIYDAQDGTLQTTISKLPHSVMGLAISPDEKWLCARFNYGGQVAVWSLPDMGEVRRFGFCEDAHGYVKDPNAVSLDISRDGTFIAVGGEGAFGVWRLETGEQLLAVAGADRRFDVRFHPSEPMLYAVTSDAIQVWKQDGDHFVEKSPTAVHLKDRHYAFADDAPILCILDNELLTLYRLPSK